VYPPCLEYHVIGSDVQTEKQSRSVSRCLKYWDLVELKTPTIGHSLNEHHCFFFVLLSYCLTDLEGMECGIRTGMELD